MERLLINGIVDKLRESVAAPSWNKGSEYGAVGFGFSGIPQRTSGLLIPTRYQPTSASVD